MSTTDHLNNFILIGTDRTELIHYRQLILDNYTVDNLIIKESVSDALLFIELLSNISSDTVNLIVYDTAFGNEENQRFINEFNTLEESFRKNTRVVLLHSENEVIDHLIKSSGDIISMSKPMTLESIEEVLKF